MKNSFALYKSAHRQNQGKLLKSDLLPKTYHSLGGWV